MAQTKDEARAEKLANDAVEKVETSTKLTDVEKEKYFDLSKAKILKHFDIRNEFKDSDPDKFKALAKANNSLFSKNVLEAFGNTRGRVILDASRKK